MRISLYCHRLLSQSGVGNKRRGNSKSLPRRWPVIAATGSKPAIERVTDACRGTWRRHIGRLRRVGGRGDFHQGTAAGAAAAGSGLVATTPSSRRVLDHWIRRHLGYAPIGYAYLAGEEAFTWGQPSVGWPAHVAPDRYASRTFYYLNCVDCAMIIIWIN